MTARVGAFTAAVGRWRIASRRGCDRHATMSESALIAAAAAGDRDAFAWLMGTHEGKIRGLLLRLTGDGSVSDDLAQEVFFRAFRGVAAFRGGARLGTWLYRIAYNVFLNHRSRTRQFAELPPDFARAATTGANPLADPLSAPRSDLRRDLGAAIGTLPDRYRAVVVLYYLQEVTYPEIAEILDLPLGTVKTHLHRAKRLLRTELERSPGRAS